MSDSYNKNLLDLFDIVETGDDNKIANNPDCEELENIENRYDKHELAGQGGIKKVWAAKDNFSKRIIAYAEPRDDIHPVFYDSLLKEAWLTSSLQHPNIIKIHDVGINSDQKPFFTMDFKRGQNLASWRFAQKKIDLDQCLDIFLTTCEAIEHAHSKGIIHLDLKPENIQLDSFSEIVVCDWGMGQKVSDAEMSSSKEISELSEATESTIGGTPGFMAPEQIKRDETPTQAADIYGLGALLYYLISGKRCHEGESAEELIKSTLENTPRKLRERFPDLKVSKTLDQIIQRCLQLKVSERYQSVSAIIDDLRLFLKQRPTSFENENKLFCTWLFYKRQNLLCNLALVILLIVSLSVNWFSQRIQAEAQQRQLQEVRALKAENKALLAEDEIQRKIEEIFKIRDQSREQKKAKANELNDLVDNIKRRTMYLKTKEAVNIMEELSSLAMTLDPDSHMAKHQMAEVHFIQLNTAETKRMLKHYTPDSDKLLQVFQDCPSLNFTRHKRPSKQELIDFLKAINYNGHGHILAQRVILYDYEIRSEFKPVKDYEGVVQAYFEAGAQAMASFVYDYDKANRRLTLNVHNPDKNNPAPRLFLTQYLDLDTLVLKGDICNLTGLRRAKITTLDISQHLPFLTIEIDRNLYNHPTLKTIILKSGSYPESVINRLKSFYELVFIP
ncbi:serine/threonine-protein kinase [Lentisphaera araneosa HTCC2155]|uniref:Serine/threonine-protein kinase n=1 Tax=Lentisphaera araneosa HTCC2155 TaxID=313628 RepID=A6DTI4_9BACT|nr:serine/threonine-protein kinase [Lentisphaera araneosa]EDM25023.1 serine/threonine-protein kinase [Lentisphaera araneosa HTCC2155]